LPRIPQVVRAMGNEIGTLAGAAATTGVATADVVTMGRIQGLRDAERNCARYTARQAEQTTVGLVATAASSVVVAGAVSAANIVTLGALKESARSCRDYMASSVFALGAKLFHECNGLDAPNELASALFFEFTANLPNHQIRCWLAESAQKCYEEKEPCHVAYGGGRWLQIIHAHVYHFEGKSCLAIRGTQDMPTVFQDIGLVVQEEILTELVGTVASWARQDGVDYITGHSLGGFLAEAAASRLGMDGAAFNSPGGRGWVTCYGSNWSSNTRFEVHLNKIDPVSLYKYERHIAEPQWHMYDDWNVHSMGSMVQAVRYA